MYEGDYGVLMVGRCDVYYCKGTWRFRCEVPTADHQHMIGVIIQHFEECIHLSFLPLLLYNNFVLTFICWDHTTFADHEDVQRNLGQQTDRSAGESRESYLEAAIDKLLRDDVDRDGYISYVEYRISNRRFE
ncbi:hypothetical protein PoB_002558600 [Plakobranchus ocellatus]|uniref:EF-hand domain-containing protein n=1 Tax=Plakobranchus ocellatus TaxID=259542 RepID=A0AAV3ZIZ2_9GAST|nr:hypothetical protein PoB_002558600 [Plakobranchus ocellatus]